MSRGPGVVQRAVLEVASDGRPFNADDVLVYLGYTAVGHSERESVSRAIRTLAGSGKLEVTKDLHGRTTSAQKPTLSMPPKVQAPPKPVGAVQMKQAIKERGTR